MGKATQIAAIVAFGVVATIATIAVQAAQQPQQAQAPQAPPAAEEAAPSTFVTLKLEGSCDSQNTRLWLVNSHTYKTIATTVRWRAAGGKDLSEQFFPGPNSVREIGCAAEAEILDAKFADF
ncbi:hypothetical protein ACFPN2_16680 [Steroidobacter flavus]|uniref:Uncharacterized protein n=1 Tax=Steroidobacter flavus TaxID=1842136 RepID=A0ABV8STF6_9GAMM